MESDNPNRFCCWALIGREGIIEAMTKKRLLLITSLPLTIALTIGVLAMLPPSRGITKANFDHIEDGMTMGQVEAIFGGQEVALGNSGPSDGFVWHADDKSGALVLFAHGCVVHKYWRDSNETTIERLLRWFHLRRICNAWQGLYGCGKIHSVCVAPPPPSTPDFVLGADRASPYNQGHDEEALAPDRLLTLHYCVDARRAGYR